MHGSPWKKHLAARFKQITSRSIEVSMKVGVLNATVKPLSNSPTVQR